MAEYMRKVPDSTADRLVNAEAVRIVDITNPTMRIKLEDGTTLLFTTVVSDVFRHSREQDERGNPRYTIASANIVMVVQSESQWRDASNGSDEE